MNNSDNKYMLSVANGNLKDLSFLFQKYHAMIFNYFKKKSGNNIDLSQDLTQTVFERILKYKNSFKQDYNFKSWIYRIATNVYTDHFRNNKLKLTDLSSIRELPDETFKNDNETENKYAQIIKAMQMLSETDREIIQLSKIENLRIKEIAEILDLSESAVKVKIHRSIKKLKHIIFK